MSVDKSITMLINASRRTTDASLDHMMSIINSDRSLKEKFERVNHIGCVMRRCVEDMRYAGCGRKKS